MSRKTKNVAELKFFSTGQIARMYGVSLATVQKWIDAGELECFRMPLTDSERRVPGQSLIDVLKKYDFPMDELYGDKKLTSLKKLEVTAIGSKPELAVIEEILSA